MLMLAAATYSSSPTRISLVPMLRRRRRQSANPPIRSPQAQRMEPLMAGKLSLLLPPLRCCYLCFHQYSCRCCTAELVVAVLMVIAVIQMIMQLTPVVVVVV